MDKKKFFNYNNVAGEQHPFHIVRPSPWPFTVSFILFCLVLALVSYFHYYKNSEWYILFFLTLLGYALFRWFTDIVVESTFQGFHTFKVQQGIRYGMVIFIVSEAMFFFSFFWAFIHCSVAPSIWIGCVWPPVGIETINPWGLPLLNTIILISSGVAVTHAHRSILAGDRMNVIYGLSYAIFLGLLFTLIQFYEYVSAPFNINDGIYGSLFYVLTGFHGIHVIVGTVFLFVTLIRHIKYHLLVEHHLGLETSIWYWHFVDVIWILLFIVVYWWGGK